MKKIEQMALFALGIAVLILILKEIAILVREMI